MTQDYYGTKRITAWRQKSPSPPTPGAPEDAQDGYAVKYSDGYISWSPKDVFEAAYQPITAMNFGHALQAMKDGHKVARAGWNGKGMWIALTPGSTLPAHMAKYGHAATHRAVEIRRDVESGAPSYEIELLPHIDMRTADGALCVGWLASQTDMLADDWQIVE